MYVSLTEKSPQRNDVVMTRRGDNGVEPVKMAAPLK